MCCCPLGLISCSQDKTVRLWVESSEGEYRLDKTLVGHKGFVGAVKWVSQSLGPGLPDGTIVSGSMDKAVILWDMESCSPAMTLEGHTSQVTAFAVLSDGSLVSASVDGTLRIWQNGRCTATLTGHEGPIWCLLVLPDDRLLSGSVDKTARLWQGNQCIGVLKGHNDTIRGLALVPGVGVVSASHDATLRVWTLQGDCTTELVGHSAIIYCVAVSENGLIASGSEDNTCRLWRADGSCQQVIDHPGCVWDVAFMPNGDLCTACSDTVIRMWSRDSNRKATPAAVEEYAAAVAEKQKQYLASTKGTLPPGLKVEDEMALLTPGKRHGQNKVVSAPGGPAVYSWNGPNNEWEKIGDVMTGSNPSKVQGGKTWDYVFDVDVEEGAPPRKLTMNRGENPHQVAERFLIEENLPSAYKGQIVDFILRNTSAADLPRCPDPLSEFRSADAASGSASRQSLKYAPKTSYVPFDNLRSANGIITRIREINSLFEGMEGPTAGMMLDSEETGDGLIHLLEQTKSAVGGSDVSLSDADKRILGKLLQFPPNESFPAMDICRMLAVNGSCAEWLSTATGDLYSEEPGPIGQCLLQTAGGAAPSQQCSLQFMSNCFIHPPLRSWIKRQQVVLLERFKDCSKSSSKQVRAALATLILNFAALNCNESGSEASTKTDVLSAATDMLLSAPEDDFEAAFRAIVAVGTLAHQDPEMASTAKGVGLLDVGHAKASMAGAPDKLKDAVSDLDVLLK
eukprot:evm.model.scf_468.8 EVM.evm.TU.scf_468.8   scf_468:46770-53924(-)